METYAVSLWQVSYFRETVTFTVEILQNFVAFSEYMNITIVSCITKGISDLKTRIDYLWTFDFCFPAQTTT